MQQTLETGSLLQNAPGTIVQQTLETGSLLQIAVYQHSSPVRFVQQTLGTSSLLQGRVPLCGASDFGSKHFVAVTPDATAQLYVSPPRGRSQSMSMKHQSAESFTPPARPADDWLRADVLLLWRPIPGRKVPYLPLALKPLLYGVLVDANTLGHLVAGLEAVRLYHWAKTFRSHMRRLGLRQPPEDFAVPSETPIFVYPENDNTPLMKPLFAQRAASA